MNNPILLNDDFDFTAAGNLWADVVKLAKADLRSEDGRDFMSACVYFFTRCDIHELADLRKFDALCIACGIDPNVAAESIFYRLTPTRRRQVCEALREAGCGSVKLIPGLFLDRSSTIVASVSTKIM